MSERDDLVTNIMQHPWLVAGEFTGVCPSCPDLTIEGGYNSPSHAGHIADHLLAAGYRRPRTITTVEELDALANGSSVLCLDAAGEGHPAQKSADGWGLPFSSSLWNAQHLLDGCESITVIQEWAA